MQLIIFTDPWVLMCLGMVCLNMFEDTDAMRVPDSEVCPPNADGDLHIGYCYIILIYHKLYYKFSVSFVTHYLSILTDKFMSSAC